MKQRRYRFRVGGLKRAHLHKNFLHYMKYRDVFQYRMLSGAERMQLCQRIVSNCDKRADTHFIHSVRRPRVTSLAPRQDRAHGRAHRHQLQLARPEQGRDRRSLARPVPRCLPLAL